MLQWLVRETHDDVTGAADLSVWKMFTMFIVVQCLRSFSRLVHNISFI